MKFFVSSAIFTRKIWIKQPKFLKDLIFAKLKVRPARSAKWKLKLEESLTVQTNLKNL